MTPTPYQHDPAMTPGSTTVSSKYGTCTWTRGSRHDRDVHPGWGFGILMISTLITILDILVHVSLSSLIILRCPCDHDHNVSGQTIMSGGPRVSLHHPGEQYLNLELYEYPNILSGVPNHHRYDHIVTSNFWWKQKQTFRYEDTIFSWSKDLSIIKQDDDNTNNAWQYYLVVYYGIGLVQYRRYSNNLL
jgi:hypothetical protein